jgi:hypothetical protein
MRFWLPYRGIEQEILIPGDYVQSIMIPAAEHEAGHTIAAHHFGGRVFGIAVGFIPEEDSRGMFFQAIYGHEGWPTTTQCIVKAAGPAADQIYRNSIDERGASIDLKDIEGLTGIRSLEPYLEEAKLVLKNYAKEFDAISVEIRKELAAPKDRYLGRLPTGRIGTMLLNEAVLGRILAS